MPCGNARNRCGSRSVSVCGVAPSPGSAQRVLVLDDRLNEAQRDDLQVVAAVSLSGAPIAEARDSQEVIVQKPRTADLARLMADIENLLVETDSPAKVVINERTGTIVITRLLGMLLAALAVQFVIDGVKGSGLI